MSVARPHGPVKEQMVDQLPKRFKGIKFGIQSNQDIVNQAVLEVSDQMLYDIENNRAPYKHGPLDPRLGTSSKIGKCATCMQPLQLCTGHFGHIRLPLPVFHIGYLRFVQMILQNICKDCGHVLLAETDRRSFLKELRRPGIDNLRRTGICKRINEMCRKAKLCPYCGATNGVIKKLGTLKLAHDRFAAFNRSTAMKKQVPRGKLEFDQSFAAAKKYVPDLEKHVRKALEDLNPLRVLNLFKKVSPSDCELLGLDPSEGRPEMFIWQYLPAPPICIRPSVAQDNASTEDDLTTKLAEIVHLSGLIRGALAKGTPVATVMELWEYLQQQVAMYVNSEVPGLAQPGFGKTIRGFCQRLKGKQGRFRGNLSGKRVDFSGRTVISPDPNLGIDEVCVPVLVAKNLTYPELANHINIEKLRKLIRSGPSEWPGAMGVHKKADGGYKIDLKYADRAQVARDLAYGDKVDRHLEDGDIVLFNRQPSLHKLSIMSHLVKVRHWRTFRLNECVCTPYNADFDGDEMNLHVPQTEESRAEAITLMGVKHNLATPKNGEPIIAATQDFITAAYLISSKDMFLTRQAFTYICMHMTEAKLQIDIPPPAILKPQALWTGKQVFNMLMRPNKASPVVVNLDAKCREYLPRPGQCPDMCPNDGWLVIRNSEIMCGRMDKSTVGSGKKDSIFYVILRDFGPDAAVTAMNRLAKLCARFLGNRGFSIGVIDVFPTEPLKIEKEELVKDANKKCDVLIETFKAGKLEKAPGCNPEQTLENAISGILSKVRQQAGQKCKETLSRHNAPLTMANSGSKGSDINVAQMVACVGQQIIGGQRVPDGFQDRSLPHFQKNTRQPASKGFVKNSFYSGLVPTEFLFHAISGREGLVDTAVKTAETGYMSRRLMKCLEDLSTQYDNTVRTSSGGIVQFQFGADRLDPVNMEGSAVPVHFDRTWTHAEAVTFSNDDPTLLPDEILVVSKTILDRERQKNTRHDLVTDEVLDYNDQSDRNLDLLEGARAFIETVAEYVRQRAMKLAQVRRLARLDGPNGSMVVTDPSLLQRVERVAKVSLRTLEYFLKLCLDKYRLAHVEPGHAVGAVGAQSIGEPGTQMTLKTFHFAGVAGMSLTQGVPRIKEIINASKKISTPVITCPLQNNKQIEAARIVKGRIEKTYISDVLQYIEDEWGTLAGRVVLKIHRQALMDMHLEIGLRDIAQAICRQKKMKVDEKTIELDYSRDTITLVVPNNYVDLAAVKRAARSRATTGAATSGAVTGTPTTTTTSGAEDTADLLLRVNYLRRMLPTVPISGYADATRAIIQTSENNEHEVFVEGYGLRDCMVTEGVIGTRTNTNSILECRDVLGIEAARTSIAVEIGKVMGDMNIDPRHMELLADVMTYKGEVLGITRFGMSKMRDSVLHLASFEKTPDHLFEAAAGMKTDRIEGVSECIIMGQTMTIGTGAFSMVRRLGITPEQLVPRRTCFEDAWQTSYRGPSHGLSRTAVAT
ncbi:DNA-directed RNA polymerase III subunit RPC1 [Niveomyces insectorum RCEF 264]|uniref:DNA-directed RNA polymerase subunit n=1 Tax=Niveomyces insectorum RCEF 264 TaxID=1081102 RepID=A0A162I9H1_9HYPO|nr:DNA-directed RNA polymerase III subunit RPC1 [Niveomyces insectorum RCEF 264]